MYAPILERCYMHPPGAKAHEHETQWCQAVGKRTAEVQQETGGKARSEKKGRETREKKQEGREKGEEAHGGALFDSLQYHFVHWFLFVSIHFATTRVHQTRSFPIILDVPFERTLHIISYQTFRWALYQAFAEDGAEKIQDAMKEAKLLKMQKATWNNFD